MMERRGKKTFKEVQAEMENKQRIVLKHNPTRFVECHTLVERFIEQYKAVYAALKKMSSWHDRKASSNAVSFLAAMEKSDFVIGLKIMKKVSAILRPLSLRLQSKGADLVHSLELIDAVKIPSVRKKFWI